MNYKFSDWWESAGFTVGFTALIGCPVILYVQDTSPTFNGVMSLIFLYVGLAGVAISQHSHPFARLVLRFLGVEAIYRGMMTRRLSRMPQRLIKVGSALSYYDERLYQIGNASKEEARQFYWELAKRAGVFGLRRPFEETWDNSRTTMDRAAYSKMMWESGAGEAYEEGKVDFGAPPVRHEWLSWIYSDLTSLRHDTEQEIALLNDILYSPSSG